MVSDLFKKNIYAVQRNNYGHAIFIMKEIFPGKISKEGQELFIKHVVETVKESLVISKKLNKTTAFAHIYLNECRLKNFSMPFKIDELAFEEDGNIESRHLTRTSLTGDADWSTSICKGLNLTDRV